MSSLPHPEGVAAVIELLAQVEALDTEIEKLKPMAQRLAEAQAQARELRQRLPSLLSAMDVEAPGNFGWERRMGWFLAEMRRQLLVVPRCDSCAPEFSCFDDGSKCSKRAALADTTPEKKG